MSMSTEELEKIRRVDHDTLIRVETKVDNVADQLTKLTDGMSIKIQDHEVRIRRIEVDHERIGGVVDANKRLVTIEEKVHDFGLKWKFIIMLASAIGSVVTIILTIIGLALKIIK